MAFTFEVETGSGSTTANSYASVSDGDDYHSIRLGSEDWQNTTAPTRQAALAWATRILDEQVEWKGSPANVGQALQWPRIGVGKRGGLEMIDNDEIPQFLKDATAELARYLIQGDRTAEEDTYGFSSMSVEGISLTVDKYDRKGVLPRSVLSIVSFYGTPMGSGTVRLVRT